MVDKEVEIEQKSLTAAWKSYITELEKKDTPGYNLSLLKKLKPKVYRHNIFKIIIGHKVEKERLTEYRRDLMTFLRMRMEIPNLSLEIELNEIKSNKEDSLQLSSCLFAFITTNIEAAIINIK